MLRLMTTYRIGLNWIFAAAVMDLPRGPIGDQIFAQASDDGAHAEPIEAPLGVPGLGTMPLPPDIRRRGLNESDQARLRKGSQKDT